MHGELISRQITMQMMEKALSTDIEFFDNPAYYDKLTAASRDSYSLVNILWNVLECISSCITFTGTFAVLCGSNPLYGIAVLLAAFPSAIAGVRYTKSLFKLSVEQLNGERRKSYIHSISTTRQHAQDIRLFDAGGYLKERYAGIWNALFGARRKMLRKRSILTGILELLPELAILGITIVVCFRVLSGGATVGDYSLYTGLAVQLNASVFALSSSALQIYDDKLRIANIKALDTFQNRVVNNGGKMLVAVGTIEFCGVTFAYPGTMRNVLEDISFTIAGGEKVALVGLNGSGKSTLIKLLLRFYDVDQGSVKINGTDIREYELKTLRHAFSVYFQDMQNYGFTLRENMQLADRDRTGGDGAIYKAFSDSDAKDLLERLPGGLDTYLTRIFKDDGAELSGGQNQKVALARAFYRRNTALILDEPSSNLDPEAEHRVFEGLKRLCEGKTTLFTSHRLSNIVLADRIVVIENGRIIEQGSQSELLRNKNRYAELFKYQQEKFKVSIC
jgi:ABC-type multidrug transport system fused ATPase/permease subunit